VSLLGKKYSIRLAKFASHLFLCLSVIIYLWLNILHNKLMVSVLLKLNQTQSRWYRQFFKVQQSWNIKHILNDKSFYLLGCMPVFIKHGELNQYKLKSHFRWSLSTYILWYRFLATCLMGFNIIGQYTCILMNNEGVGVLCSLYPSQKSNYLHPFIFNIS
jgi:hypothetical protein